MSLFQAALLAAVQGITELFPVSSLAHAVILPRLFGWPIDQKAPEFLPFLVMLHLGTASALLIYFWRDWIDIARGLLGIGSPGERASNRRLLLMIVVGTGPGGDSSASSWKSRLALFSARHRSRPSFSSPMACCCSSPSACAATPESRSRRSHWHQALFIGLCQCGALIPGLSRSGLTMGAGLAANLTHAGIGPLLFPAGGTDHRRRRRAGVAETSSRRQRLDQPRHRSRRRRRRSCDRLCQHRLSHAVLQRHDFKALDPFAYYCLVAGVVAFGLLQFVF